MSASASIFAASPRSAADLARFFAEAPTEAADYAVRLAQASGLQSPVIEQLQQLVTKFDQPDQRDAALRKLATEQQAAFSAFDTAKAQAARAPTLGFTAGEVAPVTLTGRISVQPGPGNRDLPKLTTPDGKTYELQSPAIQQTGGQHLYVQHRYLEASCLKAFDGLTVTLKAFATTAPNTLAVQSFAPGTPKDFVSGRLALIDGKLLLRVLPDKNVEITNPTLVQRLSPFANLEVGNQVGGRLGIILPGAVTEQKDGRLTFDELPENYWMLAKQTAGNPLLELAHGQRHAFLGDVSAPAKYPDQRIFVFGHIDENGTVVSGRQGALAMPPAIFEDGTAHVTDGGSLAKLVPVQNADSGSFAGT